MVLDHLLQMLPGAEPIVGALGAVRKRHMVDLSTHVSILPMAHMASQLGEEDRVSPDQLPVGIGHAEGACWASYVQPNEKILYLI